MKLPRLLILLLLPSLHTSADKIPLPEGFLLVAHRGHVTESVPENSLAALDGAIARGYSHVEVDIRATKDGIPVCLHDGNLRRTVGTRHAIAEITFPELRAIASPDSVPTLEEFCAHASGMVGLMPDIKGYPKEQRDTFIAAIRDILTRHDLLHTALFIGRPEVGETFAGNARKSWGATLEATRRGSKVKDPEAFARDYFIFGHAEDFDQETVDGFHALGAQVIVSINEFHYRDGDPIAQGQADIKRMIALGVDGLQLDTSLDGVLDLPAPGGVKPWTRHTIDNTSRGADGVRLGDINGDGRLDIATAWEEGSRIRVYLQPAPDAVRAPWPHVTVAKVPTPEDAVFMDLDGDGDLDVLSATEGKSNTLFLHFAPDDPDDLLRSEAWTTVPLPQSDGDTRWLFCLPLDGQTFLAAGKGAQAGLYRYTLDGNPRQAENWKALRLCDAGWVMSLRRLNQAQVIMSNRRPPEPGLFLLHDVMGQRPRRESLRESDNALMFLDFPREEQAWPVSVYAGLEANALAIFPRDTAKESVFRLPAWVGTGKGVAVGDLDGDGRRDLAFTCEHAEDKLGVGWLSDVDHAPRLRPIANHVGTKFDRIELFDVDGDGDLDLFTCEEREGLGVIWYENPTR